MATFLLVLQLAFGAFVSDGLMAHVWYGTRQDPDKLVIVVTYPAPGTVLRVCSVFYDGPPNTDPEAGLIPAEIERHCWTPNTENTQYGTHFDIWPGLQLATSNRWLTCFAEIRLPNGKVIIDYVYPLGQDS